MCKMFERYFPPAYIRQVDYVNWQPKNVTNNNELSLTS